MLTCGTPHSGSPPASVTPGGSAAASRGILAWGRATAAAACHPRRRCHSVTALLAAVCPKPEANSGLKASLRSAARAAAAKAPTRLPARLFARGWLGANVRLGTLPVPVPARPVTPARGCQWPSWHAGRAAHIARARERRSEPQAEVTCKLSDHEWRSDLRAGASTSLPVELQVEGHWQGRGSGTGSGSGSG